MAFVLTASIHIHLYMLLLWAGFFASSVGSVAADAAAAAAADASTAAAAASS